MPLRMQQPAFAFACGCAICLLVQVESDMWVAVKAAAVAGHQITGILNPANGPGVANPDPDVPDDRDLYKTILNSFLNKGDDANGEDDVSALTVRKRLLHRIGWGMQRTSIFAVCCWCVCLSHLFESMGRNVTTVCFSCKS